MHYWSLRSWDFSPNTSEILSNGHPQNPMETPPDTPPFSTSRNSPITVFDNEQNPLDTPPDTPPPSCIGGIDEDDTFLDGLTTDTTGFRIHNCLYGRGFSTNAATTSPRMVKYGRFLRFRPTRLRFYNKKQRWWEVYYEQHSSNSTS